MKRVAGRRLARGPQATGEFPYVRYYAPNDGTFADDALLLMGEALSRRTGRIWLVSRENDMYLRLYCLPFGHSDG